MIKAGDILHVRCEIISIGGLILMEEGDKVTVRKVEIEEGHYSRLCPDIWYPPKITGFLLEDRQGVWLPIAFYECLIGEQVKKVNIKKRKSNKKKFKSGKICNTVKGVIDHPVLGIPAFVFEEDESYVECRRCELALPKLDNY